MFGSSWRWKISSRIQRRFVRRWTRLKVCFLNIWACAFFCSSLAFLRLALVYRRCDCSFQVVGDSCEDENLDAAPLVDVVEWLDPVDPVLLGTHGGVWRAF